MSSVGSRMHSKKFLEARKKKMLKAIDRGVMSYKTQEERRE